MNIGFWDSQLCERGTTTSLFDYAYYNQKILKNKSFIFYDKYNLSNKKQIIKKFKNNFIVHETNNFKEVDFYIKKYNISHIYIIKFGKKDNLLSKIAKNCIHCVYTCHYPHGDIYSSITPYVYGNDGKYPVVPHMINLPKHNDNMRNELDIPEDAIVFGGYGGKICFSIKYVQEVVYEIAKNNSNIYFLFANFNKFGPELKNVIYLDTIYGDEKETLEYKKVKFINTFDAMLWARKDGEMFGIAIGEFCLFNKPIITTKSGHIGHWYILKDKAIWYNNKKDLTKILLNFDPNIESKKDWNGYKDFTPEKVMKIFKNVYLK